MKTRHALFSTWVVIVLVVVFGVLLLQLVACAPDANEIFVGRKCKLRATLPADRDGQTVDIDVEVLSCQK